MRVLRKIGLIVMFVGILFTIIGGVQIQGKQLDLWLRINPIHLAGVVIGGIGFLLTAIGVFSERNPKKSNPQN